MKKSATGMRETVHGARSMVVRNSIGLLNIRSLGVSVFNMVLAFTLVLGLLFSSQAVAQEEEAEPVVSFDAGMDLVSSYVWRGSKFGTGPAFQPFVEMAAGGFTFGGWGSVNSGGTEDLEMDLYMAYDFAFGLSVGVTDYYFGAPFFTFDGDNPSHGIEANVGYEIAGMSIGANYFAAGASEGDMYFELGYAFPQFSVALGAGDGAHTSTGELEVCNISVSTEKEIAISDKFSLPLFGSLILNPQAEQFFVVVGVSL